MIFPRPPQVKIPKCQGRSSDLSVADAFPTREGSVAKIFSSKQLRGVVELQQRGLCGSFTHLPFSSQPLRERFANLCWCKCTKKFLIVFIFRKKNRLAAKKSPNSICNKYPLSAHSGGNIHIFATLLY